MWTSWAHHATRCVVLARTEGTSSGSRGITAFFIDMDSPGVDVRPLQTMADVDEFCETFFDEVRVPAGRVLGERGDGWAVAALAERPVLDAQLVGERLAELVDVHHRLQGARVDP